MVHSHYTAIKTIVYVLHCLMFITCVHMLYPYEVHSAHKQSKIHYNLALSFEPVKGKLLGTAQISVPPKTALSLSTHGIEVTGVILQRPLTAPKTVHTSLHGSLILPVHDTSQLLYISYEKTVTSSYDNIISEDGITLLHDWYPRPSEKVLFSLQAELPKGFISISQTDTLTISSQGKNVFSFSKATQDIHFCAGPFVHTEQTVRNGLTAHTLFSRQNNHLADSYLQAANRFLLFYEELLGSYPFNHFVIVENIAPTGYGMPTFTLLGKSVIQLPFIKDTSLGHEILHSWFGNSILTTSESGNWTEGLTTYLADWYYRELAGEGTENRKHNFNKYLNLVSPDTTMVLNDFHSASHHQHNSMEVRSIGYIRGAMLFHELRKRIGEKTFFRGLRDFVSQYTDKEAGWEDIQAIFEKAAESSLEHFFKGRLHSPSIPSIHLDEITTKTLSNGYTTSFRVGRGKNVSYDFILPITLTDALNSVTHDILITQDDQVVTLQSDLPPLQLTVDEEYDLLRNMDVIERIPTWSFFMGHAETLVAVPAAMKKELMSSKKRIVPSHWKIVDISLVKNSDLSTTNLIVIGKDNPLIPSLFGKIHTPSDGIWIDIRPNPVNHQYAVAVITGTYQTSLLNIIKRMNHYGKYSSLHFKPDGTISKKIKKTTMGKIFDLRSPPTAIIPPKSYTIHEVIRKIGDNRVIYIGETHTSMTDHHLQHLIIKALYSTKKNVAIGMEMFPDTSQQALDKYILLDEIDEEKKFLKESRYFKVWRYDYRLYKTLIDFAKQHSLPVVALNVDRQIVNSIFRNNSTDSLSVEQRKSVPKELDLGIPGYYDRLKAIFRNHAHGAHSSGKLSGFIQAQAVWDEAMAENIANYIADNPSTTLVVLAGSQHTRKDNGIPPRVKRRLNVEQTVIHSLTENELLSQETSDFLLSVEEKSLEPAGKIGITLEERNTDQNPYLEITSLSPQSNAKDAGLKPGDRVLSIDGYPIMTMEDVRIALSGKVAEESIKIEVLRNSDTEMIPVILYGSENRK